MSVTNEELQAEIAAVLPTTEEQLDDVAYLLDLDEETPTQAPVEPGEDEEDSEILSEEDINRIIDIEIENSDVDRSDGTLEIAMQRYFGQDRGDEVEGRSKIKSTDVADVVESLLELIVPTFANDMSVRFADDEFTQTTNEEAELCNYIIHDMNDSFILFYTLFKDALLQRNGIAKVSVEDTEEVEVRNFTNLSQQELGLVAQARYANEEVEVLQEGNGLEIRYKRSKKRIIIEVIPRENFKVNSDHKNISLKDARCCVHTVDNLTQSDLVERGYDMAIIEEVSTDASGVDYPTVATTATRVESHETTRPVKLEDVYIRLDYDGDGVAEIRRILRDANAPHRILENERMGIMPFASLTPFIVSHRWEGLSIYDKFIEIEDAKTGFLRKAMDNADKANNARVGAVRNQVDEASLISSKPGGVVWMKRPDAVVPFPHDNTLGGNLSLLEYLDSVRSDRGGSSVDMKSGNLPVGGETAHGIERQVSAREITASFLGTTFAQTGVRDIYIIVHRLLKENFLSLVGYRVNDQAKTAMPARWPTRERVKVKPGISMGERVRQAGALNSLLEHTKQLNTQGLGGVMIHPITFYKMLNDLGELSDVTGVKGYYLDPNSKQGQQAAQAKAQQMQQQMQIQLKQQEDMINLQRQVVQMQEETKRLKADNDYMVDMLKVQEEQRQHIEDMATKLTELEIAANKELNAQVKDNRNEPE